MASWAEYLGRLAAAGRMWGSMIRETLLSAYGFRYLKLMLVLCAASVAAYLLDHPKGGAHGGTWLGYTLGTVGALLIVWLILLGARKRAYRTGPGTLRGWLSAHVYLGLALALIGTLHTGFHLQFRHLNVHDLSWVLMMLVIASGIWGVAAYLRNPLRMSELLNGRNLAGLQSGLDALDEECRALAASLGEQWMDVIERSAKAPISKSLLGRLGRTPRRCPTAHAVAALREASLGGEAALRELYALQVKRAVLLAEIRDFVRTKAWTDLWLLFHVPLSFALLAALIAHIVSVFLYW